MLLDEARIAATLVAPPIVQVFDVEHPRRRACSSRWSTCTGMTLRTSLARRRALPLAAAVTIAIAVAAGLHYAHERAPVGRPSRRLARQRGRHLRRQRQADRLRHREGGEQPRRHRFGAIKGKPGYSSPEQCRCETRRSPHRHLLARGLLYELTTGRRAFGRQRVRPGRSVMAEARVAPPREIDPTIPPSSRRSS